MRRWLLTLLLALCLAAPLPAEPPAPTPAPADLPRLRAQGTTLRDPAGRQAILRGVNLSHRSKLEPYLDWITEEHVARVRGWGLNLVRLLLAWDGVEPTAGAIDAAYLDRLDRVLGWCDAHGLYVVLDMHQDLYGKAVGGNGAPPWATVNDPARAIPPVSPWFLNYFAPNVAHSFDRFWASADLRAHYVAAWRAVIARARPHPSVLGYDLINEPHFGSTLPTVFEARALSDWYTHVIGALAPDDPDRLFFFEPVPSTVNQGAPTWLRKPPFARVVYAPHYYDPITGFGGGYDGRSWRAEAAFVVMKLQAARFGVPLFLGEWGVPQGVARADAYNRDELSLIERYLVPASAYWNYNPEAGHAGWGDGMSVLAPDGSERPVVRRLAQPYPKFVAGTISRYGFDPTARRFSLVFRQPASPPAAPTVIHLDAARHYPEGFAVECSDPSGLWDWSYDPASKELTVHASRHRASHEVRIRPAS